MEIIPVIYGLGSNIFIIDSIISSYFLLFFFLGNSKQRNKKDVVKQPSEVPNEITTIKPETTSISEVANPQPSTEPSTVNIASTAQLTKSDHSLNSSTVQQQQLQPQQEIIPNHVESNHISEETSEGTTVAAVAEEMSKLLIEDAETKAAIENGNGSASSSATASKSSSQIKQKLKYAEHYADGKFDGGKNST